MHILPGRPPGKPDQMSPIRAAVPHDLGRGRPPAEVTMEFSHNQLHRWLEVPHLRWMLRRDFGATDCLVDLGFHLVDLLLWLRPEASIALTDAQRSSTAGIGLATEGIAHLDWGGTPVEIRTSWCSQERLSGSFKWDDGSVSFDRG